MLTTATATFGATAPEESVTRPVIVDVADLTPHRAQSGQPPWLINALAAYFYRGALQRAGYPSVLKDDAPVRKITLDTFYMDEAEVTNERYAAFARSTHHKTPYQWRGAEVPKGAEKRPVVNVSWDDATAFCAWDGGKRLPTEAEWERACRGIADGRKYPWGDSNPTARLAVYGLDNGAVDVCTKEKNYFGLCDMIGNVWEWTSDWYGRNYYEAAPDHNPPGPPEGRYRVVRGGSWFDTPDTFLTCSYRSWARQPERSPTIGFRCVKTFPRGKSTVHSASAR